MAISRKEAAEIFDKIVNHYDGLFDRDREALHMGAEALRLVGEVETMLRAIIKEQEVMLSDDYSLAWENAAGQQYTARRLFDFMALKEHH